MDETALSMRYGERRKTNGKLKPIRIKWLDIYITPRIWLTKTTSNRHIIIRNIRRRFRAYTIFSCIRTHTIKNEKKERTNQPTNFSRNALSTELSSNNTIIIVFPNALWCTFNAFRFPVYLCALIIMPEINWAQQKLKKLNQESPPQHRI